MIVGGVFTMFSLTVIVDWCTPSSSRICTWSGPSTFGAWYMNVGTFGSGMLAVPIAPCCAIEYVSGSASASVAVKLTGDVTFFGTFTAWASAPTGVVDWCRSTVEYTSSFWGPWPRLRVSAQAMSVHARPIAPRGTSSTPRREPSVGEPPLKAGTGAIGVLSTGTLCDQVSALRVPVGWFEADASTT